ncbi:hypothetical protein [Delftia sp. GW456-R20]|uniref:hypothetical protein n=1 Tax=Delftia sp. GW456-R20 TaxID=1827145 RepID=UPI000A8B8EDF|nr:hypothetical protein [Delftia sp. GW456-R20]
MILSKLVSIVTLAVPVLSVNAAQHFWVEPKNNNLKDVVVANDVAGGADGIYTYSFGGTLQRHSNWNVGDFSHLNTPNPLSDFQASINPNGYGSTSVQKQGAQVTLHLHSYSLPTPSPMGWYYMGWGHQINKKPWAGQFGSNPKMCLEHSETVVDSYNEGAVFYNGVALWLMDKNGRQFHYSIKSWDSRWPNLNMDESAFYDEGISGYYVGTAYAESSNFLSLMPFSHSVNGSKGENLKWYGMCISKAQLSAAINAMNSKNGNSQTHLDLDAGNYEVTGLQISSEIGNLSTPFLQRGAGWYTSRFAGIHLYTDY